MFKRAIKFGVGAGIVCGSVAVLKSNHWDISTTGIVRFGRAAFTVSSIVVDYKFSLRNIESSSEDYESLISQVHTRSAKKLLQLCCINGGSFIKVGQHIGALDFLLPSEYVNTMKVLHSQAPKASFKSVKEVIREEFHKDLSEMFSEFDEEPIGAASLAQVHRAKLKNGEEVAVKVQHLNVRRHSFVDITSMELLVNIVAKIFPDFSFLWLANEMKINLPIELDFLNEGKNSEIMGRMFKHLPWLKIPKVYWDHSSVRVLTMEYVDGCQINDLKYMQENNISVNHVTKLIGQLYSEMIFLHGYVHCDPHPGNVLVKTSPSGLKIVLLDHGLYVTLKDEFRLNYSRMWLSLINADMKGIKKYSEALGVGSLYPLFACMMTGRSWNAISSGIDKIKPSAGERKEIQESVATYFPEINEILRSVPREMLLIFKTNDLLRNIESSLKATVMMSFITMSRCCAETVFKHQIRECSNSWCSFKMTLSYKYVLSKIMLYECFIFMKRLYNSIRNIFLMN